MESGEGKKQYDQMLALYSKRRIQNETRVKEIANLNIEIPELEQALANFNPEQAAQSEGPSAELDDLRRAVEQQRGSLEKQEHEHVQQQQQHWQQIQELKAQSVSAETEAVEDVQIDEGQLQAVRDELASLRNDNSSDLKRVEALRKNNIKEEAEVQQMEENVKSPKKEQPTAAETEGFKELEEELAEAERELKAVEVEIESNSKHQAQQALAEQQEVKRLQEQLDNLIKATSALQQTQQSLIAKLNSGKSDKTKKSELDLEMSREQATQARLQKDIVTFEKDFERKKKEKEQKKKEAKKDANKQKYKLEGERKEAEKESQILEGELNREEKKLEDTRKLRNSYVSNDNLQILQKEYERHQVMKTGDLETEQGKKVRAVRQRDSLQSKVKGLKTSRAANQREKEQNFNEIKSKGDQLLKDKLDLDKLINKSTNRVNEFMKEYPNHEKQKEQRIKDEHKRKAEEREKVREAEKQRKLEEKQAKEAKRRSEEEVDQQSLGQDWQGSTPTRQEQPSLLDNNRVWVVLALLAVVLLAYFSN